MKIKRLEISGFKSFADKVVLDFQQGVTGVVGPNGCGKSNIVDAIRWCMGEQSAKNLRGKAMEDVIFAGSESRKPLGMAEVSLIFSTEDGRAPAKYLDYAEVQLTRRLYRDGDSDYLINRTPCRLMDITELFMDTGVGTRAYSIIEQGKIGQILHSRPEERRFLIEEAAGVTKFKSRKQLALKKIEATRVNLSRLADVLGEIRRQLSSLQRQAKKAEKFREYRDELREIEMLFTAREYRKTQEQRAVAERDLVDLNARIRAAYAAAGTGEVQVEEKRLALAESEKGLSLCQEEIFGIRSESSALENGLEFHRKELSALTARLARLEAEAGELGIRLKECDEQQELLELRRDQSAADAAGLRADLEQAEALLARHQQAEEELGRLLESRRRELFAALAESSQNKGKVENAVKRLAAVGERLERHAREGVQLAERLELARRKVEALDRDLEELRLELETHRSEQSALRQQDEELKKSLPEIERQWQKSRDELNRSASRLHSLKELEEQFAGYGQGVQNLMKAPALASRFRGILADIMMAPPDLEGAVEAVLADRLQCIQCHEPADAVAALEYLKKSSGGRAALALAGEYPELPAPAVAGAEPLAGLVETSGPFAPLVRRLLAGCLLVDTLEEAIRLCRQYPDLVFVTRDGDLASLGGVIAGGSAEQVRTGIIHKKREIRDLEAAVTGLRQEVDRLGAEREQLTERTRTVAEALRQVGSAVHQGELRLAGLGKDRQQAADEIGRIEERLAVQTMDMATLEEEQQALEAERKLAQEAIEEGAGRAQGLEEEVARTKGDLDACRAELAAVRERTVAIRVQVATLGEQHESNLAGLVELQRRREELAQRIAGDGQELEKGTAEQVQLQQRIEEATARLEGMVLRQVEAERRLAEAREANQTAAEALAAAETVAKQVREEHEAVRQAQGELNLRFSTLTLQAQHLEQGLQEKSRIPMTEALARLDGVEFDEPTRLVRQGELQRLLDEMGEVNLMAIEECAGMEERHAFLAAQKEDLEESLRSLQQAIQRINRTTRQRFMETYNLVNEKFQEVFPRLFCGGKAELRLTNEEDLLETGIDIIVQPPGKKLQNVTLLSGGEKALTAVALIFSIFLIKPTPFCLLDEVDAPLDDANIGRFNDMVREMSAISQFIIITHNKATMQVADTLYGITMETPGASRVVSVRLNQ